MVISYREDRAHEADEDSGGWCPYTDVATMALAVSQVPDRRGDDVAFLQYTSGSTSDPKVRTYLQDRP